jgi:hypothetical protein
MSENEVKSEIPVREAHSKLAGGKIASKEDNRDFSNKRLM